MVKFGEIAREVRTVWKEMREGVPVVGLEHIVPGEMELKKYDLPEENTFTKKFCKGQVLFGRRRAYQKKATVATFDGICSGDITVIEPIPGMVVPELLPFIVANDRFFDHAIQGSAGSLSPRVKWEHMANYEFELPTLGEQKVLANKLWAAYRLKEAYQRLLNATDEMVKSQFLEMFGSISNPNYEITDLGSLVSVERGGSPRPISDFITDSEDGINWIKIGDSDDSMYITKTAEKIKPAGVTKSRRVYVGDLLLSNSMSFGRPYILKIDGCIHDGWLVLHYDKSIFNDIYLCSFLSQRETYIELAKLADGAVVSNLNKDIVKILPIIIAPIKKQEQFAEIVRQADKSKFELRKAISAIDEVIKSLING